MGVKGRLPARRVGQLWSFTTTDSYSYVVMLLRHHSDFDEGDMWLTIGSRDEGPSSHEHRPVGRFAFFEDIAHCYSLLAEGD